MVAIIPQTEARARITSGTKTWRFRAEKVRDVAWAAAGFQVDRDKLEGILAQATTSGRKPDRGKERPNRLNGPFATIRRISIPTRTRRPRV